MQPHLTNQSRILQHDKGVAYLPGGGGVGLCCETQASPRTQSLEPDPSKRISQLSEILTAAKVQSVWNAD